MNNTKKRTLAIAAILIAATLVVGGTLATTTTKTAFASNNGNTVTAQINRQTGIQSGWDNTQEQEAQNVICTHPGNNATCSQEVVVTPTATTANDPCVECFTRLLTSQQITIVLASLHATSLADLCTMLRNGEISAADFIKALGVAQVDKLTFSKLVTCLRDAGIHILDR